MNGETYGPLKAMCERAGRERFGEERTSVIRPTYVAGPHDPTDRFTYWARRTAVAAMWPSPAPVHPCRSSTPVTLVRSSCAVQSREPAGAFDAVGPWAPIEEFLATITPEGVDTRFVDVGWEALEAAGIGLPLLSADPS